MFNFDRRFFILSGIISVALVLIFIGSRQGKSGTTAGEYVSPDSPAFLLYKKQTYQPLVSDTAYNSLVKDLATFARKEYTVYNPAKNPSVIFNLTKDPIKNGANYELIGKYEKVKNSIRIQITELNNSRIKLSIYDQKQKVSIDNELSSNSKVNKYISTLPIGKPGYRIYFDQDTQKITVRLYGTYSDSGKAAALLELSSALGNDFVNDTNIDLYYTQPTPADVAEQDSVVKARIN